MFAALLVNLPEYGGREWLKSQAERDRLLKEDEDLIKIITTLVTVGTLE